MGSTGVSPLACGSVCVEALMLCTCLSVVHGGKRPLPLQPTLVRLFLGVDELKEELLTEFKPMVPLAGFSLDFKKRQLGRDWGKLRP